jgi:hypothetical protein
MDEAPCATISNADSQSKEVFEEIPTTDTQKMKICHQTNDFSRHNNRHLLQNFGEYFDLGFGKQKVNSPKNHHVSEDSIKWTHSETPPQTSYQISFITNHSPPWNTPMYRRFPKLHLRSNSTGLLTSTTTWFKEDKPFRTPTQLLASSQEPHLPHNPWKYSYKAININAHLPAISRRHRKTVR